jgi:hypothetical protein
MSVPRILLALATLACLAPVASAVGGPLYVGTIHQGESKTYTFDNRPLKFDCVSQAQWYSVSLTYSPDTDVLTLTVPGIGSASGNGAILYFTSSICTTFDFTVAGTSVADTATFKVQVLSGRLAEPVQ